MPRAHDDDDHTIANMNIEGMPWYDKRARGGAVTHVQLRLPERWLEVLSSVLAGLMAVGVIIGVFAALILFCTNVWLK